MEMLKLNEVHENYIGMPEGISATLTESGIQMLITFDRPIEQEIEFVKHGQAQFKLIMKNEVPFILSKFGGLKWMESPMRVDNEQIESISNIDCDTIGYGLYVILADTRTGMVKVLRAIGLGNGFSKEINKMLLLAPILTKEEYLKKVFTVQRAYTTKDLVKMSYISYNAGTKNV